MRQAGETGAGCVTARTGRRVLGIMRQFWFPLEDEKKKQ